MVQATGTLVWMGNVAVPSLAKLATSRSVSMIWYLVYRLEGDPFRQAVRRLFRRLRRRFFSRRFFSRRLLSRRTGNQGQ